MHDYQLCYWYCLEIERSTKICAKLVADHAGRVVETSLKELIGGKFLDLLAHLGLPVPSVAYFLSPVKEIVPAPVNPKREIKNAKSKSPINDYEILETAVAERVGPTLAK